MNLVTLAMMILGVVLSVASGMVCYMGPLAAATGIDWLPHADLMLCHPGLCLGVGAAVLLLGIAMQPTRS
ncbi:MAG: hypothetical protein H6818_18055 [Phycisphaerales bacterium]|nr:hypothetical protein [Phycisphaerales bacterium]